jgi:hypothetical protein
MRSRHSRSACISPFRASSTAFRVRFSASPSNSVSAVMVVRFRTPRGRPVGLPDFPFLKGRPRRLSGELLSVMMRTQSIRVRGANAFRSRGPLHTQLTLKIAAARGNGSRDRQAPYRLINYMIELSQVVSPLFFRCIYNGSPSVDPIPIATLTTNGIREDRDR